MDEIDLNAHVYTRDGEFIERTRSDRSWFVNIAAYNADPEETKIRHELYRKNTERFFDAPTGRDPWGGIQTC